MNNPFFQQLLSRLKTSLNPSNIKNNPIHTIFMINTALYIAWKTRLIPESFLVKHFSFERFNIRQNRFHTFITYAFSHFGIFTYLFDMITFYFFAKATQLRYGSKYVWMLYLTGALFGSTAMYFFMPNYSVVLPQVGCDGPTAALITFLGLTNLSQRIYIFMFPMPIWALLMVMATYSLILDPSKKNFAGMVAGVMVYQMFKVRMF